MMFRAVINLDWSRLSVVLNFLLSASTFAGARWPGVRAGAPGNVGLGRPRLSFLVKAVRSKEDTRLVCQPHTHRDTRTHTDIHRPIDTFRYAYRRRWWRRRCCCCGYRRWRSCQRRSSDGGGSELSRRRLLLMRRDNVDRRIELWKKGGYETKAATSGPTEARLGRTQENGSNPCLLSRHLGFYHSLADSMALRKNATKRRHETAKSSTRRKWRMKKERKKSDRSHHECVAKRGIGERRWGCGEYEQIGSSGLDYRQHSVQRRSRR